jgi:hypothetical protein
LKPLTAPRQSTTAVLADDARDAGGPKHSRDNGHARHRLVHAYPNGYGRPHVRLALRTDDGALILLEYHGIVQATSAFTRAVESDTSTQWDDQYMRMALTFDTAAERYAWLMESLFIARGRLLGAKAIEYDVYRVQ